MLYLAYSEEEFDEEIEIKLKIHNTYADMDSNVIIYVVLTFVMMLLILGCCMRRNGGPNLSNPPARPPAGFEPDYPQQQYNAPYPVPVVTGVPYPVAQAATPYPAPAPYPTYPAGMPVPTHLAQSHPGHYPQGFVPGRYPAAGAPYPTASYPSAPSAPEANAMPPTYDQAVCARRAAQ
ncbi:calpain-B-like isoform X2 [Nymphalis io]|uniref:calpain-B-like isoform X2 n=1 Tax=Inachis io TaxID=171585 RepID=UPI002169AD4E|nr:calpain-B-like isoform X2 [Nymphalis io]